jgi:hypothetical protein
MNKKIKIHHIALGAFMALCAGMTSCDDFLTIYPTNEIVDEQFWEDKNDLDNVVNAVYRRMIQEDILTRYIYWGECRSDNFTVAQGTTWSEMTNIMNANLQPTNSIFKWQSFYQVINWANKVLEHGDLIVERDESFSKSDWLPIQAEMKTVRALAHFYLVRTFGDVPLMMKAIDDDSEDLRTAASPADSILTTLIADLESVENDAMTDFGTTELNKGRVTQKALWATLADMYLWRASMRTPDENEKHSEAVSDYNKVSEYCDKIIAQMKADYIKENSKNGSTTVTSDLTYPLIENSSNATGLHTANNKIFGSMNSSESIFELQISSTDNYNEAVCNLYRQYQGSYAKLQASKILSEAASGPGETGFYTTDMRKWESLYYDASKDDQYYVCKYTTTSISQSDVTFQTNVVNTTTNTITTTNKTSEYSSSSKTEKNHANWIVYRLTDIMLMKAEALAAKAMLGEEVETNITDAFDIVNEVYLRSNPYLKSAGATSASKNNLTQPTTAEGIEALVLNERQRELVGEGKRWFDLLRYALRRNSTADMIDNYLSKKYDNPKVIQAKLNDMRSLYSPIYNDEIKANDLLEQNPIWNQESSTSKTDNL